MRLGDSERERLLDVLGRYAVGGMIDAAERERRVEVVLRAQTREAAESVLVDLPPLPAATDSGPDSARPRRGRGHGEADAPQAGWHPTAERFRDPRSRRVMRVWVDAGGGRHYLAEPPDESV